MTRNKMDGPIFLPLSAFILATYAFGLVVFVPGVRVATRVLEEQKLSDNEQEHIFITLDALIRDF
ncbi:hypothetical protein BW716_33120 [[Flexibacter] sp. ATCC 35208]|nr:hypothetical protein BW716_33120 [[Flexibacter] sp. ATCC 35208]